MSFASYTNPQSQFDVFLSHNSKDKPNVRILKEKLVESGLTCWLDADELVPGGNWQTDLQMAILKSSSVAVCFGPAGIGPWEDEEIQASLLLAVDKKKHVIPVILPGAPKEPDIPLFLRIRTWVDLRDGFSTSGLNKLLWGITGRKPDEIVHPFDGTTLNNWSKYPGQSFWLATNSQIIGSGLENTELFNSPDNPTDLKSASMLIWQGLALSQGMLTAKLLFSGIGKGAAGFILHNVRKQTGLMAILRKADYDALLTLEFWCREEGSLHLLESVDCLSQVQANNFFRLAFKVGQDNVSLGILAAPPSQEMVLRIDKTIGLGDTLGNFGLIKFGYWSVHFSDIKLIVTKGV